MRKYIAVLAAAAVMLVPAATANASEVDEAGVGIGGVYGPGWCYVALDYFRVDAAVQSAPPFVAVTPSGSVGGSVHCPLPPF